MSNTYPRGLNFLVGGNILGRGITIENLLVTYYLRAAKVSQMDTVLQHARMFGYRASIMKYTRLYSPPSLVERFAEIHEAERSLRALLKVSDFAKAIAVVTPTTLRATRANVLDTRSLSGITPGQRFYWHPGPNTPKLSATSDRSLRAQLAKIEGPAGDLPRRCPLEALIGVVEQLPFDEGDGWPRSSILAVLRSLASSGREDGYVYHLDTTRALKTNVRYAGLTKSELAIAVGLNAPTLVLLYKTGERILAASFLFPEDMPAHVFNITES